MEETDLVDRAKSGEAGAFSELVRLHQGRVRAFLSRFVRNDDVADDLAQEVFIKAHQALPKYQPESTFGAWLLAIARNQALAHFRSDERRRAREAGKIEETLSRWSAERMQAAGWSAAADDRRLSALTDCLQRLPSHSAAVVEQHYFRGLKAVDIARESGRGEGVVRMLLLRVRQVLRRCVEERAALETGS